MLGLKNIERISKKNKTIYYKCVFCKKPLKNNYEFAWKTKKQDCYVCSKCSKTKKFQELKKFMEIEV